MEKLTTRGNPILKMLVEQHGLNKVTMHYNMYARKVNSVNGIVHKNIQPKTLHRYCGNGGQYDKGVTKMLAAFIKSTIR